MRSQTKRVTAPDFAAGAARSILILVPRLPATSMRLALRAASPDGTGKTTCRQATAICLGMEWFVRAMWFLAST